MPWIQLTVLRLARVGRGRLAVPLSSRLLLRSLRERMRLSVASRVGGSTARLLDTCCC